jgi:hypothetical protein
MLRKGFLKPSGSQYSDPIVAITCSGGLFYSTDLGLTFTRAGSGGTNGSYNKRGYISADLRVAIWQTRDNMYFSLAGANSVRNSNYLFGDACCCSADGQYCLFLPESDNDAARACREKTGFANANWYSLTTSGGLLYYAQSCCMSDDGQYQYIAESNRFQLSTDYGQNFTNIDPSGASLSSIRCTPDGKTLVVLEAGDPWISTDYGVTWVELYNGIENGIDITPDGQTLVVTGTNSYTRISYNGGASWSNLTNTKLACTDIAISRDANLIMAIKSDTIYRKYDGSSFVAHTPTALLGGSYEIFTIDILW